MASSQKHFEKIGPLCEFAWHFSPIKVDAL